jgi:YD repeat-containing protein
VHIRSLLLVATLSGCRRQDTDPPTPTLPGEPDLLCVGEYVETEQGGPATGTGSRIQDASGRVLEETETWLASDTTIRTQWLYEGPLLLEERYDEGADGLTDAFVLYGYDSQDRLIQSLSAEQEQLFEYDEEGQLVRELVLNGDGSVDWMRTQVWQDGRVTTSTLLAPDGIEVYSHSVFTYEAPSPSLDHEEWMQTPEEGDPEALWRRTFDGEGHLLTEDTSVGGEPVSELAQTWDTEGRLVEQRLRRDSMGQWSLTTSQWVFGDDGLLELERIETDLEEDGTVDRTHLRQWSWVCGS